jgi:hypothetical protein
VLEKEEYPGDGSFDDRRAESGLEFLHRKIGGDAQVEGREGAFGHGDQRDSLSVVA